jgi:ankyrin repeat protein
MLSKPGFNTEVKDETKKTALMIASWNGHTEVVKLLVENGADVNAKTKDGFTALIFASMEVHAKIVKLLLEKGANVNDKDVDGNTGLIYASTEGDTEVVKLLVEKGARLNHAEKRGYTALTAASENGHTEVVKLLLDKGAHLDVVEKDNNTALIIALKESHYDIVKLLVEKGADVNAKDNVGFTPLMIASKGTHTDIVKLLVEKGANVNAKNNGGYTALMYTWKIEIVKLLLDKGARINDADKHGRTFFFYVAGTRGSNDLIKLLLEKGVDVNAKANDDKTALINASYQGNAEIVKLLLENGANVNDKDVVGMTGLMYASAQSQAEVVKIIVEKGADVNAKDNEGKTALDHAKDEEIRKFLRENMDSGSKEMWKGLTRADIENLDVIFDDENASGSSLCPVCLKFLKRDDGCMYMSHNCTRLEGYYHKRLYSRFKNSQGIINWCTICNRICKGHSHYHNEKHDTKNTPEIFLGGREVDVHEKDCRLTNNGGGLPEKVARFRRLREVALELQDEIDKITKENAMNELVEAVWNAPLDGRRRENMKTLNEKKWRSEVPLNKFRKKSNNKHVNAPNIPFSGKLPTKKNSGMNNIMMFEDDDIIEFHHKQRDGSEKKHGATKESLIKYIGDKLGEFGQPTFGYCFMYPQRCDSKLHPEELKGHIPDKLYNNYREAFNLMFKDQRGGNNVNVNNDNVFQKATDAFCAIGKNTKRFEHTRNKKNGDGNTSRKRRI